MPQLTTAEVLAAAAGLDPSLKALEAPAEPNPFEPAKFTAEFKSAMRPGLDGTVVIRYPTLGDSLKIEALARGMGPAHEAFSTLLVCVEKAPASWWHLPEGAKEPQLNLAAIPDSDGVLGLWEAFLRWRRTFR